MEIGRQNKSSIQDLHDLICLFDGEFSIDWLIGMTNQKPSEILVELEKMVQNGWLENKNIGHFSFCDPQKKSLIYEGISPLKKERLFQTAVTFFLNEFDGPEIDPGILGKFLLNTTNDALGCRGLLMVGDAFVKKYQPDKALECYSKLKTDLLNLKGEEIDTLFIDMAIKTSKVSTARQSTTVVIRTLEEALDRALKRGDEKSEALIRMHIAKNEWLSNRYDRAMKLFKQGWNLANQFDDEKLMRSAMALRMYFSFWQGRYKEVIRYYENAVSDVEKYPEKGFPLLANITVGQCYAYTGQITQGLGMLDAIHQSCLSEGDLHTAAYAISTINSAIVMIKPTDEALELFKLTYADIQQSGNQYIEILTEGAMAYLYYKKGDIHQSVEYLNKFVQKCREVNIDTLHHRPYLLELCWAMEQGRYPRMMNLHLEEEVNKLLAGQNVFLKGLAYRYRALLEMKAGQPNKNVLNCLKSSLKWLEASGHEFEILITRFEMVRAYLLSGHQEKAKSVMGPYAEVISKYHDDVVPPDLKRFFDEMPSSHYQINEILRYGREIMTLSDSRDMIQKIISSVNQLTGAERGGIFLVNKNVHPTGLTLRASKNLTYEDVAHPSFCSSTDFIEKVIREPGNTANYIDPQILPEQSAVTLTNDHIRSRICVPIMHQDRVKGVLYHDNRLLNSVFKASDIDLLSFYAGQAAIVLDNLSLQEEIHHLNEKMREDRQFDEERHYPAGQFEDIIGKSDAIQQMLLLIEQVAATDINILILGETGVGKDLVANAIHHHSARRRNPFIKANCSALTETLINSELFGHEKGAFTGAANRRIGRFEMANGGTLFMDEIGDLPLSSQANLLRTLQSREFERVGGNETLRSDFRLIAATNRDLNQMVKKKQFRADLYFRLNVFPIPVAPLRERKEDIPMLVHHFIRRYCLNMNKDAMKVPASEMKKLIHYDWPGNVRELENVIQRGIVLNAKGVFKIPDQFKTIGALENEKPAQSLQAVERDHILWALEEKKWKIRGPNGVAELLKINPSTLTARMKKLNIKRPRKNP